MSLPIEFLKCFKIECILSENGNSFFAVIDDDKVMTF